MSEGIWMYGWPVLSTMRLQSLQYRILKSIRIDGFLYSAVYVPFYFFITSRYPDQMRLCSLNDVLLIFVRKCYQHLHFQCLLYVFSFSIHLLLSFFKTSFGTSYKPLVVFLYVHTILTLLICLGYCSR